jgi:glutamate-5-semialdehyde dehydrogenase
MSEAHSDALEALVVDIAENARKASYTMATLPTDKKNAILERLALLCLERKESLQKANEIDLKQGAEAGLSSALLDRLTLHDKRIDQMVDGLRQVAALPDPVGHMIEAMNPPSGLDIRKIRVPIGVIGIIYESRPNVTIDCAALCIKSGNAAILRGGKEAFATNSALAAIIEEAFEMEGVDKHGVCLIPSVDRRAMSILLKLDDLVHCIIPRGGEGLIRFVAENARMPVIKHYTGVCSAYVHSDADGKMARAIVVNAKTQRPGVCNAIENLFVHEGALDSVFPEIAKALAEEGVQLRVTEAMKAKMDDIALEYSEATEADFGEEYLDLIIAIDLVSNEQEAIEKINQFGSGHSDVIITESAETAEAFMNGVDGATVYWNASTRFTDGFEFGLGAEIGISTDRLHARGPMGLNELCSYKFKIFGKGEIRI